jgi:hypothetical protein
MVVDKEDNQNETVNRADSTESMGNGKQLLKDFSLINLPIQTRMPEEWWGGGVHKICNLNMVKISIR